MERTIAKLFIILLPLRMLSILTPITSVFGMQAESFSVIFLVCGLLYILISNRGRIFTRRDANNSLFFWKMIIVFAIISIIMSVYVSFRYGNYNGNSPYIAVLKLILDFIQYGLVMIYCKRIIVCLGKEKTADYLLVATRIPLIIGYMQIAEMLAAPVLSSVYKSLAAVLSLRTFPTQISLTFYEPSWAAMFISIIVIPIHMSRIMLLRSNKSIIELLLWLPLILMTKSTTAYILVFVSFGTAIIRMLFVNYNGRKNIKVFALATVIIGVIILLNIDAIDRIFGFNFSYLVLSKLTDLSNQSTASRMIPLIGNLMIFIKFPLIGCGNGLQGYFYPELISYNLYSNLSLDKNIHNMLAGTESSIPNGQLFIPGILSGYGIVGILLFAYFIRISLRMIKHSTGLFKEMYMIALLPLLISGFKSEFVGILYIWFVLGLPFAISEKNNSSNEGVWVGRQ